MAWVRYDDQFYANPKVTAVIAEDPGAISLHVLANTWTNGQKRVGYIPAHQPGMLICDKTQGQAWAAVLVKCGLWHEVASYDCDDCMAEYGDIPPFEGGYIIHNAREYRAPARERQTPGTPADLSEKRKQAGRAGGKASGVRRAKREQSKQEVRANEANDVSKTSNLPLAGVSPVVKPPYGALTPEPVPGLASDEARVPPSAGTAKPRPDIEATTQTIVAEWLDRCQKRPPKQVIGQIGKHIKSMLDEGIDPDDVRRGLATWMTRNIAPSHLPAVVNDVMNGQARAAPNATPSSPARSTTDERVAQAQALKSRFANNPPPMITGEISP